MDRRREQGVPPDKVLSAADLLPFLQLASEDRSDLAAALASYTSSLQLHEHLEHAFDQHRSRLVEVDVGRELSRRVRTLRDQTPRHYLEISLSVSVMSVSIPDSARDEMLITLRLTSGANLEELLRFLIESQLLGPAEAEAARTRWVASDSTIGSTELEMRALERVLGVAPVGATDESNRIVTYNYGTESGSIWRTYDGTITVQASPGLSNFPRDETVFRISLRGVSLDPSESGLVVDRYAPIPVSRQITRPPRGFDIVPEKCGPLRAVCISPSPEDLLEGEVRFDFALRRQPGAFKWRVLMPAYLILLMGFISTYFALAHPLDSRVEVMTQLLPAMLIAAVALQLTAAQQLPARSGATRMDRFFVASYATLLLQYLSLELQRFNAHWPTFLAAAALLAVASWTWRDLFERR